MQQLQALVASRGDFISKRGHTFSIHPSNTQLTAANSTCNDLSASTFSILGSLNDSREIKKLDRKTRPKNEHPVENSSATKELINCNLFTYFKKKKVIIVPVFWHLCTE